MTVREAGNNSRRAGGFSLIELVIVVVIIGIIGAIAIPRMSRGSEGAAVSALIGNLSVLNKAIDLYATEHSGDFPRAANIVDQLTGQTDIDGDSVEDGDVPYGPYLRAVPTLPIGEHKGDTGIATADGNGVGWIYLPARGVIVPNLIKSGGSVDETLVTDVINASNLKRIDLVKP